MDKEQIKKWRPRPMLVFKGKGFPVPVKRPKPFKHLRPDEDPWAMDRRWWLVTVGATLAALAVGLLVGRFLLP
jgi:hypothetical protein